jgi:acetoacetyl-CoA reductase
MADMNGQVALVTGGIRGIGLAICERLMTAAYVAAGYSSNHDDARLFSDKHADHGVTVHQGNIGRNEDCERVIGEVLDQHGHLDILVNNAGITVDKTVRKMTPAEWDHVIHVNLSGAFYLSRRSCSTCWTAATAGSSTSPRSIGLGRRVRPGQLRGRQVRHVRADHEPGPGDREQGHHRQHGHAGYITTEMTAAVPGGRDGEDRQPDPGGPARRPERGRPRGGVPGRPRIGYITGQVYPVNGGLYM